ncbi:hypothetical protein [Proteiniphilum acetatigenes]|uniref:hypothetical protein n=1 Tax=Proteiniphilum acetatigenes TaxID=294710 RepID=UPI00037C97CE|nr:hypothetical protein [Proteiniphilum acetatigenes]SFK44551.1 hypothetical protein SAMN05216357_102188 [Porphyromonadaceae bacterium KH3CP3RA]
MLTDDQLRDRLHRQITNLPPESLRLVEQFLSRLETDTLSDIVREDPAEYLSGEKTEMNPITSEQKWHPNEPFIAGQEEWFQYFREIEEGEFTPLEEANQEFEQWKAQQIKNRL